MMLIFHYNYQSINDIQNIFEITVNYIFTIINCFVIIVDRPLKEWTVKEVNAFLTSRSLRRYKKIFEEIQVTGRKLSLCSELRHLQQLGVDIEVDAMELLDEIKKLNNNGNMSKHY